MPNLTRFRTGFYFTPLPQSQPLSGLSFVVDINFQGLLPGDQVIYISAVQQVVAEILSFANPIPGSENGYTEANYTTKSPSLVRFTPAQMSLIFDGGSTIIPDNSGTYSTATATSYYTTATNVKAERSIGFAVRRSGQIVWFALNMGSVLFPATPVNSNDQTWGEYIPIIAPAPQLLTPCMPGQDAGDWQKDAADLGFAASLPDASNYGKAFAPIATYKGCTTDTTPQQPAPIIVNLAFPSAFLPPSPITFARDANFGFAASYVIDAGSFDEVTFRYMSGNPLQLQVWGTNDLLNGNLAQVPVFVHESGRIYTQTRVASGFAIAPIVYRYLILANTNPSGGLCRIEVALRSGKTPLPTFSQPEFRVDSTTAIPNGGVFISPLVQFSQTPWAKEVVGVCNCNTSGTFALEIAESNATWWEQQRITTIANQGVVIRSPLTANLMRFVYRNGATPANVRIFRTIA